MNKRREKYSKRPSGAFKNYLKFLLISLVLLVFVDQILLGGDRGYFDKFKQDYAQEQAALEKQREVIDSLLPPKVVYPQGGEEYFEAPPALIDGQAVEEPVDKLNPEDVEGREESQPVVPLVLHGGKRPRIAIVIDDVGMNVKWSKASIDLPAGVTLAFLPYAAGVRDMAAKASEKGHELIIHAPMEAMSDEVPLGSIALMEKMDYAAFDLEFAKMANSFDGYVGVNNHMGSRLTQNKASMGYLMDQLKQRQLYFLDSKTIAGSVAADTAAIYGVPYAVRDVFLDHEETPDFVAKALQKTEEIARRRGSVIAIGHPKEVTITALQQWVQTLDEKGYDLVPVSTLIE